jgi:transposase-like protein
MSDTSSVEGGTVLCPVCDSTNTEESADSDLDYRCLDCGAKFDLRGGQVSGA